MIHEPARIRDYARRTLTYEPDEERESLASNDVRVVFSSAKRPRGAAAVVGIVSAGGESIVHARHLLHGVPSE
jgi:hypothetical protein